MFELRLYKQVDDEMYLKDTISSSNKDSLIVMAKIKVKFDNFTDAVICDMDGGEVFKISKKDLLVEGAV